ncbi:flagellar hook-length control protein FliK, partial [candidate division KSB1 bacterium]
SFWGMRVSAEPSDTRVPSKPINIGSEKNSASEGKTLPTPANPAANSNAPWSVNPEQSVRDSIFKTNENANAPRAAVSESHTPKQAVERHSKSPIVQQPSVKPAEVRSVHTQPARAAVVEKNVQSAEQTTTAASNPKEIAAAVSQPVEVRYAQTRRTVGSLFRKIISKQPAHIAETNTAQPAKDSGTASRSTPENSIVSSRAQDAAVRPNEQKPVNELPVSSQQTRNQTPTSSAKPAVAVSKALPQPVVNLVQTAQPENAAKYSTADSEPRTTQTDTARIKTEVTMPTYAPAVLDREPRSSANSERTAGSARQQASTNETAALNTQPTTDTPSAAATTSTAPARESLPVAEAVVRPLRMLWTTEQIKELQSLAQRALQTVQTVADGTSQAVFTWTPENLGPLQFKIITRKDDVEIEINSSRQDVADALEEGRGTIERIIGDLGLRIERFDIRVRVPSAASDQAMTAFNEHHPERNSQAQQDGSTPVLTDGAVEEGAEEPTPTRRRLAEHEWVA